MDKFVELALGIFLLSASILIMLFVYSFVESYQ